MSATGDILAMLDGRFSLVEEYSGGEGSTLCVTTADAGAKCVVKVLPIGVDFVEASLLQSLRHPAIPAVREVGQLRDGRRFVVRDHVDGRALQVLPRDGERLHDVLRQLLEVLAYVHLRGVLHLDLKPANLLLGPTGRLHLLDFGLGVRGRGPSRGGTPFFAAPELLLGGMADERADLFSVGAMVAQALWPGEVPLARFLDAFPRDDFFTAGGVRLDDFPAPFDRFLRQCVSRRLQRRFPDASAALELLCGGSGRPSLALLDPDPVALFEREARLDGADGDVLLRGGAASDRRALALHFAATLSDIAEFIERDGELCLVRAGRMSRCIELPLLDGPRLVPHVQAALGLEGAPALAAATWLAEQAQGRTDQVGRILRELAHAGQLVPSGTRWTWPAARGGRLEPTAPAIGRGEATTPAHVRASALAGRRELAIQQWRHIAAEGDVDRELAARVALAEGLLDAGDPAQALPFCGDMPVLRAQALLDTGQVVAAEAELARLPAEAASPRQRRCAAQLAIATGHPERAIAALQVENLTPLEAVTLAAAHEQAGDLDRSEQVLRRWQTALEPKTQPFACASARTVQGHVARRRGDLMAAKLHFQAASELLFAIGQVRHAATAQLNLGVIAKDLDDHRTALDSLRDARALYLHVGDEARAAVALANLGIAALARGDAATARPWLQEASSTLLQQNYASAGRLALVHLARAHVEMGDPEAARAILVELGGESGGRVGDEAARLRDLLSSSEPTLPAAPEPMSERNVAGPSRELFRTFLAVNRQLAVETDLDKAMRHLLDAAVTLTGGRMGYLLVAREDGMRREFQSGDAGPVGQAFSRSLAHRAMQLQRTLTGADGLADRELQDAPSVRNLHIRSAICSPFRSAGGTVGAVYVEHPGRAGAFADADKESLEMLADQAAIAVDRMLREEAMASELNASQMELAVVKRVVRRESSQLLGNSRPMVELRAQIDKLAPLDLSVLILGETGTGKELVARALHDRSGRHRGPFVAENCSALPPELMERELFGHVQGAFTGADRDRPGLLEIASGGTLFLDEVGDMPPSLQAKLLRALQEKTIRRVGGSETVQLDLRLVAATHKDLRAQVQSGEFREDLFFRIAAVEVVVPPLRDRGDDILLLAEHFARRTGEQRGRAPVLSKAVRAALRDYAWPGNVRELEHVIARAVLLCDSDQIEDAQLPILSATSRPAAPAVAEGPLLTLKEAERRAIVVALQLCGGDKAKTARSLEISRTALYEKLKRHGLIS